MSIYDPLHQMGIPVPFQATALAAAILLLTGFVVRRQIAAAHGGVLPDAGVSLRNVMELVVEGLSNLARDNMGDEYRRWFPICPRRGAAPASGFSVSTPARAGRRGGSNAGRPTRSFTRTRWRPCRRTSGRPATPGSPRAPSS